nr:adenylate/guanylate cyclase domain-containing protein [Armatimonas sp.]
MNRPEGTVTLLFTDIEGSTKLWETHPEQMRLALARHDALLREAIEAQNGYVFKTIGDAFCAAFATAPEALAAALAAQLALLAEPWPEPTSIKVRMALHTGAVESRDSDYFGPPLNRVARLLATGHGGQTLLTQATQELVRDSLPPTATLRDLGVHQLKDLARPEQVYQLQRPGLPESFPALKSLSTHPNNLPQQVTSFIGREKELVEVQERLAPTRLLTLTGAGGSGKSRLSLQAAADLLERFSDGVFLVELAPLADPNLVVSTVASVLCIKEEVGKPILATLTEALKTKTLLLLLDNCEHVLDASAKLADALIRSCPGVKILATSREGLGIAGESTYRVPSLSLPDPRQTQTAESLSHFESVQLFIDRALQTQPHFAVTNANAPALASICFRLDGIPLAIELAAARARSLSVEDINTKLDQRFRLLTGGSRTALPRQQTLRSLIDWSYDLLSPAEKALLCRLSVFAGGWTLESAEAICVGGEVEDWEVLDHLTSLCDKSLAVAEPVGTSTRYRLLETVRQYSRDRLLETGDGETYRDTHLAFFLALAEETEPQINTPKMKETLDLLESEIGNFRAALEWSGGSPERAEAGLRLVFATNYFVKLRIPFTEAREQVSRAMASPEDVNPSLRAKGFHTLGTYANSFYEFEDANRFLQQSLELRQELNERLGIAQTLHELGWLALQQKDNALAQQRFEASLAIFRELDNLQGIAKILNCLGINALHQDDKVTALRFHEEYLQMERKIGDPGGIGLALYNLGGINFELENYHRAGALFRESLGVYVKQNIKSSIALLLESIGFVLGKNNSLGNMVRLWGQAERLDEEIGRPKAIHMRKFLDNRIAEARAALNDDAVFDAAWQEGRTMSLEQAVALAESI